MKNNFKVLIFWIIHILVMAVHMLLSLMPLFYGVDVSAGNSTGSVPFFVELVTLLSFGLPLLIIFIVTLTSNKVLKIINFIITILFSLINFVHLLEHCFKAPAWEQIVLLSFLLINSVVLNIVSFKWLRD